MHFKKIWINLSIANLCIVAVLGVLMRSKIIFDLPWIDYNRLVDTHGYFAFMGWATLALITLMIHELPGALYNKRKYHFFLGAIFLSSWATLFTTPFESCKSISEYISIVYILFTYIFSWIFIKDILKTTATKTVKLLSISSVLCLVLSSLGVFMLAYLFSVKSLNAILYRDALFGYLHLQYNGFFTLAAFALLFNKVISNTGDKAEKNIHHFSILLCLSTLPSMFLAFLWHNITLPFQLICIAGSILLFLSFMWFILCLPLLIKKFKLVIPSIRYMAISSLGAFLLKLFLQSLTIFNAVNILVFGNRPMIMGFLHLIFLGFVTLFLIIYFTQKEILNSKSSFTQFALLLFTIAVILNEALLMLQGLGGILIAGNPLFSWYLWGVGILLLIGTLLIALARIRTKPV